MRSVLEIASVLIGSRFSTAARTLIRIGRPFLVAIPTLHNRNTTEQAKHPSEAHAVT